MAVKLSGWRLLLALVVVAGVGVYRVETAHAKLDTQARARLQRWVQAEVIRPIIADTTKTLAEQGAALEQASTVTVKSVAVRGPLSDAIMRVELNPSPALPPGTPLVRYYRTHYTDGIGWFHDGNSTRLLWDLAALRY
ncbi:MAG TPA: hypothetical protein VJ992_12830 [Gemmatimonadales bacterium]|nr:hypothetical protein [Gemmatimonadales bacterium]